MSILELYMANSIDNTAGKIIEKLNTVRNKRKASAKRCIWEMMQNAKDEYNPQYGGVSIEFEIADENTFVFRHNGKYFTLKNITSLIQQVSSKSSSSEDEKTGMFGTGFISTHLIADVIDVKGILLDGDEKYRRFDLKLDRSGSSKEELVPRIRAAMTEFAKLDSDPNGVLFPFISDYEQHTENDFDTSFTYRIESESQLQLALLGLNDLVNTLPVTMINLPRVKSVRVINRLEGTDVKYTCSRELKGDKVGLSTIANGELIKQYLTYTTEDVSLSIEIKNENSEYYAIKRDDKLPVLLRDFPLIGSHQFYFPYFLNGFRFIPTEPRDDIQIHGDSDDKPSVINRGIFEKAVDAALAFNQWLIDHNVHNRYLLASSRIPKSTESWDEDTSRPWIEKLQKTWRSKLLNQELLESETGNYVMSEMLLPDCSKKESRETFWDILSPVVTRKMPKKEYLNEWQEIMVEYESWNAPIKYSLEQFLKDLANDSNLSSIVEKFGGDETTAIEWLNQVIKFAFEELGSDAFENYAILPNQLGTFKKASELRRDNTQPIPTKIKEVYQIAFGNDIKARLLNVSINTAYVQSVPEYNLTSLMNDLNSFIKDTSKTWQNRRDASYRLCTLYSSETKKSHRESMFELCKKFTPQIVTFEKVENVPDDMWLESDKLLLSSIPGFAKNDKCTTIALLGSELLKCHEDIQEIEIIEWLNNYLLLCKATQCTDQNQTATIFPNQKGELKKIGELSFDTNIPEELKDLSEVANTPVRWRETLLDKRIAGYTDHLPKTTSDIYRSIADAFDKSSQQLTIAKHVMALNYNDNPDVSYIYGMLNEVYKDMPTQKVLVNADGFDWEKFIACAIIGISGKVASMVNVSSLASHLSNESTCFNESSCIAWIDKFLAFAINYRGGRYKTKVTELDNHGMWVNQSGDFCMLSDLSKDGGIHEDLKDLSATNPIVNCDYRKVLLHNDSIMSNAIDSHKIITQNDVLQKIDNSLEAYAADKQNPDFRSLIFRLMELDKQLHISDQMKYYKANKEKLIVGSLGEGETMNMVAGIIQQGDEKIRVVKELLEGNTLDELEKFKEVLNGCSLDKVKELIDKIAKVEQVQGSDTEDNNSDQAEIKVEKVFKTYELDVTSSDGSIVRVSADQAQYSGLSLEEIESYVSEAKMSVYKRFKELNEEKQLGLIFDKKRIGMDSFSQLYGIYDKDGNEIPLVVHSYKGPQYRYFDLNWYDWQILSKPGSMLWVLTVSGLQCIPLYALPVRSVHIDIDKSVSNEMQTALLTLSHVGKQMTSQSMVQFEFGNNMPQNFTQPLPFDFVPDRIKDSISSIKQVCDEQIPAIANMYNSGADIPLLRQNEFNYSHALKAVIGKEVQESGSLRELLDLPDNSLAAPVVNTSLSESSLL